jgi:hypothetical protein
VTVHAPPAPLVNLLSERTTCSLKPLGETLNTAAWSLTTCFAEAGFFMSLWLITALTMFGVRRMCSAAVASLSNDGLDGGIHLRGLVPEPMLPAVIVKDERRQKHAVVDVVAVQAQQRHLVDPALGMDPAGRGRPRSRSSCPPSGRCTGVVKKHPRQTPFEHDES